MARVRWAGVQEVRSIAFYSWVVLVRVRGCRYARAHVRRV
jgi:hypothetical protein